VGTGVMLLTLYRRSADRFI